MPSKWKKIQNKKKQSLIDTVTWFLDEYRDEVSIKHLNLLVNIIEDNYGAKIAQDWG